MTGETRANVGLCVTCPVDAMRPAIDFAAIRLLEYPGCDVDLPTQQTCCGHPAHSSGDDAATASETRQVIAPFEPFDYLVVRSGSCAGTTTLPIPPCSRRIANGGRAPGAWSRIRARS